MCYNLWSRFPLWEYVWPWKDTNLPETLKSEDVARNQIHDCVKQGWDGWVAYPLGRWDKGRLKNSWYVMASLVYIDITFISIVDILQWLKKAQAGRPARILQKVGWKTRSWDLVSTLASPGNFDQMSQQCLNFFHSGMKNINCSLIYIRKFDPTLPSNSESHLVRLERQRLARRTLKTSRLFSFSLMAVTTIRLSTTLWKVT